MKHKDKLPENIGLGITVWLISSGLIFTGLAWLLWQIPIPTKLIQFGDHLQYWVAMKVNDFSPLLFKLRADAYRQYLANSNIGSWPYVWRFNIAMVISTICGSYFGFLSGKPQLAIKHIAGRQLIIGKAAHKELTRQATQECLVHGKGVKLNSSFPWALSKDRETRHISVTGSIGGGKTEIIKSLISEMMLRGDKMVIYDHKGDLTKLLPKIDVLIAPHDARSYGLHIAKDCVNEQDAYEVAERFIPRTEGTEPIWYLGPQEMFVAIIVKHQTLNPGLWTFSDLQQDIEAEPEEKLNILRKYLPGARCLLDAPEKTRGSILANFSVNLRTIRQLAAAWKSTPEKCRFSVSEWLMSKTDQRRIVVVQGSSRYPELTKSVMQYLIAMMSATINSPEYDGDINEPVNLLLDEVPHIGKIKNLIQMLMTCRSHGLRVVLGTQDIAQIKEIYGENAASTLSSSIGTHIVVRLNSGEAANYVAKEIIGYQTIDRVIHTHRGLEPAKRENQLVIEPSEIGTLLGADKKGVKALILGYQDAYLLHWPYTAWQVMREASKPAKWLQREPVKSKDPEAAITANSSPFDNMKNQLKLAVSRPRLKLRAQSGEDLKEMAGTGTDITRAAENTDDMTGDATGGNYESR